MLLQEQEERKFENLPEVITVQEKMFGLLLKTLGKRV